MALYSELPVYKESYDLLVDLFRFVKDFHREYKYTIGESIKKETIDMMMCVYRANSTQTKAPLLQQAREHIEVIRLLLRICKDLRQISLEKFVALNERVESASKQLAAWQRSSP
ncbi:four helix bundle protein [Candidatus Peregrinibacteria bacterium]|nr:four helix bundle protein [Candidatus Peregrinibacteria bacterium]